MPVATTAVVGEAIRAGNGAGDVKKLQPPEKWKSWGNGFNNTDRGMETIHKNLPGKVDLRAVDAPRLGPARSRGRMIPRCEMPPGKQSCASCAVQANHRA